MSPSGGGARSPRLVTAARPLLGGGVVSAGHGEGGAEAVEVVCGDDLRVVAVAADGDPCGAGVEVFDVPLAAEVGHDRGELAGVVPVLEKFPQRGHGPAGEDEWGRGRGTALRRVAVGSFADLPQAAELAKQGGQAGGGVVAVRGGCGVRHCHSPWVGWLVVRGVCGGGGMCARAASSVCRMRVVSSAVPGAVMMVPGGAWNRGKAQ